MPATTVSTIATVVEKKTSPTIRPMATAPNVTMTFMVSDPSMKPTCRSYLYPHVWQRGDNLNHPSNHARRPAHHGQRSSSARPTILGNDGRRTSGIVVSMPRLVEL